MTHALSSAPRRRRLHRTRAPAFAPELRAAAAAFSRGILILTALLVVLALATAPDLSNSAYPDSTLTRVFSSLAGSGWIGGDINGSVHLPDGRMAWLFGDTVTALWGKRVHLVHNSILVTGHGRPRVIANPIPPLADGSFIWPAGARVEGTQVWVLCQRIIQTGPGLWDFHLAGTWLGRIDIRSWRLVSLRPVVGDGSRTNWSGGLFDSGPYTYIYGVEAEGVRSWLHVARVPSGRLDLPWRFYTAHGWAPDPSASTRLLAGVSVVSMLDLGSRGLRLVSQQPVLGRIVWSWRASSPIGPFTNRHAIYDTGSFGKRTYTYNALAQPQAPVNGTILFSFDVNSYDYLNPTTASLYRPRFFRVPLTAI